jgi:hypothetical protein
VVRRLLYNLQKKHNPLLGLAASFLAKVRYWQGFQGITGIVWARRIYLGLGLLLKGDFSTLTNKARQVRENARYAQPNTGRLS